MLTRFSVSDQVNDMWSYIENKTKANNLDLKYLLRLFLLLLLINSSYGCRYFQGKQSVNNGKKEQEFFSYIPLSGNSWVEGDYSATNQVVSNDGVINCNDSIKKIKIYFMAKNTGAIKIGLTASVSKDKSLLKLSLNKESKVVEINSTNLKDTLVGGFKIESPGYQVVELEYINKKGTECSTITNLIIGSDELINNGLYYVKDDIYWGRRGPSVHLNYEVPKVSSDVTWFYNEVIVPKSNDILGSYYMANGFGEGYFGMQVNSETERRFLFSVWSPFKTNNPKKIPEDQRITLLKKGKDVITGKFGNEGSGGQSYRKYMWKTDTTYKFLLKIKPSTNNTTNYTAYIFAPEIGRWELIASFKRPKTSTYLKRPHSFLENFKPDMGAISRKVFFTNQWVYDTNGVWHELVKARFTADATARKQARLDYKGGVERHNFYLKNCGFFNNSTDIGDYFNRLPIGTAPDIDLNLIDKLSK